MFELEELDGNSYKIVTDEMTGSKTIESTRGGEKSDTSAKKMSGQKEEKEKSSPAPIKEDSTVAIAETASAKNKKKSKKKSKADVSRETSTAPQTSTLSPTESISLPEWEKLCKFDSRILQALHKLKFNTPTMIQQETLPPAINQHRDIVGVAETGSGKTLAYGLPILQKLLEDLDQNNGQKSDQGLQALILTPTRELAMQVCAHLKKIVEFTPIQVVPLVGGLSTQKQDRLLNYKPEIVVATPGRLWERIQSGHSHLAHLQETLNFFVIDEADRMIETGTYKEVSQLVELLLVKPQAQPQESKSNKPRQVEPEAEDEEEHDLEKPEASLVMLSPEMLHQMNGSPSLSKEEVEEKTEPVLPVQPIKTYPKRQTFLFSATLSLMNAGRLHTRKKNSKKDSILSSVMKQVSLRGKPAVVDLTTIQQAAKQQKNVTKSTAERKEADRLPQGLKLYHREITTDLERDCILYYFLTQYPGRTIVFLNSIQQVRRLVATLELLGIRQVYGLHAEMQQRQRLKKLEAFRQVQKGILVATDVAARGLDIPAVEYVVHYHISRSTEVFIHRSGRTARANTQGISLSLVSSKDMKYQAPIQQILETQKEFHIFPFDHRYLEPIQERVRLAAEIVKEENNEGKKHAENAWFATMAREADIPLDDDLLVEVKSSNNHNDNKHGQNKGKKEWTKKKNQLRHLCSTVLRPIGSKRKFRALHEELKQDILTPDGEYRLKKDSAIPFQSSKKKRKAIAASHS